MQNALHEYDVLTSCEKLIKIKCFELVSYLDSQTAMKEFVVSRDTEAVDEIWLLQHPAVYTQGTACKEETLAGSDIPIVKSDRGGQITYHGPGQIIMYPLLKLKRYNLGVKSLVQKLEQSVMDLLTSYGIESHRRQDAPGVYVNTAKISALGLRIRRGSSYHGLSFNINMDLQPFNNIHPCGYEGLTVIQLSDLVENYDLNKVQEQLVKGFVSLI